MRFSSGNAMFFVPDGKPENEALQRTTHLAIGAHQDDLEIMAWHGILHCFRTPGDWFLGVTVTDGSGSPRSGIYAGTTNEEMAAIRRQEQKKAAVIGQYAALCQLARSSAETKNPADQTVKAELLEILKKASPSTVYTHNLADKHDTHVAVGLKAIAAMRALPADKRPANVYGCEVWRGLDWMLDEDKTAFDVSANENLAASLLGLYDSQIAAGKRYDLATLSRWRANATYFASHDVDKSEALIFAMDLGPLVRDPSLDISEYVKGFADRFGRDIAARIAKHA